ncbi:MAG TPA: CDP-alcohol phosphatidyltransferase family protein [Kofleriaceae bacterium]|nr:CDP-alcohol phosphatidyltransferase family protein [Kofleriaceae bacterium]
MWPAHAVTLLRIPLAAVIALAYGRVAIVVAAIAAAAVSDAVDGNLARWLQRRGKREPDIGGWLDPLADKIFVAVVLAAIVIHTRSFALVALIGARELLLVPLLAIYLATRRDRPALHADWLGKLATVAQFFALAIAVAAPAYAWPAAITTAVIGLAAVVHYAISVA